MTAPHSPATSKKHKYQSIAENIILYFLGFMLIATLIYGPIRMSLPDGVNYVLSAPSRFVYNIFSDTSTLSLKKGKTCTQSGAQCLDAFNLEGSIQAGDEEKFEKKLSLLLSQHPNINTLCLNSPGGVNESAAAMIDIIRQHKLNTCVGDIAFDDEAPGPDTGVRYTNSCSSACTFILLAGKNRIAVGDRFVLGLHSSRQRIESASQVRDIQTASTGTISYTSDDTMASVYNTYKDRTFISDEGLKKILIETSRTPSAKMYFALPKEQMDLGFFTERL